MPIGTPVAATAQTDYHNGVTSRTSNQLTTSTGELLLALIRAEGAPTVSSVTDTGGHTWSVLPKINDGAWCCIAYTKATTNTTNNAVTANFTGSVDGVQVGLVRCPITTLSWAASPLDTNSEANGGGGATTVVDAGSLVTTNADDLLVLFTVAFGANSISNWFGGAGTELLDTDDAFAFGYQIVSSTGTYDPTATGSVSVNRASAAAAFKAVSSQITQAIGLVTETDTAQTFTSAKNKAMGFPSEADSALSVVLNGATVYLDIAHNRQLRDQSNAVWANVTGWSWAWYDSFTNLFGSLGGVPVSSGTFDTNAQGEARIDIPGTTLVGGQSGALLIRHPNYPTTPAFAILHVPLGA